MQKGPTPHRLTPILIIGLVAACESAATAPAEGEFVGRWDGRLWVGDASAVLLTGGREGNVLYVVGTAPRGAGPWDIDESVSAQVVFEGPGLYPLRPDDVQFVELTGGDVVSAEYRGSGDPAGVLEITQYDEASSAIEGELRFSARTDSPYASYGSTARFEQGRFRAAVVTQPVNVRGVSP